jgi:hypothetical protein
VELDIQLVGQPAGRPDVTLTAEGLLRIDCLIGDPPPSGEEGVRLNVKDVINFNKTVPESGTTVFIAQQEFRTRVSGSRPANADLHSANHEPATFVAGFAN